jgi:hypothetical protein
VDAVYDAFRHVRPPSRIDACPCCVSKDEVCALLATPLRQLTSEQLSSYSTSVFLTAGSTRDFRYLLPRILEFAVGPGSPWPDREIVVGALALAGWKLWSEAERTAILGLFDAAFDAAIHRVDDPGGEVDSWVCALGRAGVDVATWLPRLLEPSAVRALLGFFEANVDSLRDGTLGNAFWSGREVAAAPVIAWLRSPQVQASVWPHYGSSAAEASGA